MCKSVDNIEAQAFAASKICPSAAQTLSQKTDIA